jgi:hypothetical protein
MASILGQPPRDWTAAHILQLIADQIEEGQGLEYKRELDLTGGSNYQRKEAAKDASGMANAQGGVIIYGVDEGSLSDGRQVPVEAVPVHDGTVRDRLEAILDSAVTPRLNVATKLVEASGGGYFLIVEVQPPVGPPHMVTSYGEHRHYVRRGFQTVPIEQHEIEAAYASYAHAQDRADTLMRDLPLIPPIRGVSSGNLTAIRSHDWMPTWFSVIAVPVYGADDLLALSEAERDFYSHQIVKADLGLVGSDLRIDALGFSDDVVQDGTIRFAYACSGAASPSGAIRRR